MPSRMLFLLAAGAGLVVLAVLLARGLDTQRAAESGPRWRRYLIAAALLLLTALGIRHVLRGGDRLDYATCYKAAVIPLEERVKRFEGELAGLEAQVSSPTLRPEVVASRVWEFERRLRYLLENGGSEVDPERQGWRHLAEMTYPRVRALRGVLLETARYPDAAAEWWEIQTAWNEAKPTPEAALNRPSRDLALRQVRAGANLDAVGVAASLLLQRGLLSEAEVHLILNETERWRKRMEIGLPVNPPPARAREAVALDLQYLEQQEPLLRKIAAQGRMSKVIGHQLLESVRTATIQPSLPGVLDGLPAPKQAEASQRLKTVGELLDRLGRFQQKKDDGWLEP